MTCVPANLKEGKRWRKAEFLKKFGAKICKDREEFERFIRRGDVQKINDLLIETEPFLQTEGFYYSIVVLYLFSKLCRMRQSQSKHIKGKDLPNLLKANLTVSAPMPLTRDGGEGNYFLVEIQY